ncbi:MAG: hypothetical protein ABJ205_07445 [Erythrobacter sp.]|uniref:hypothetical protein n=1 Tax=Erythrobacter sp. TaxID=1042 RepID=UPI00326673D2
MYLSRIASVLSQRQLSGEVTRLRQIHKLTGLDQRETMKLIAELKSSGVLTVEENLSDVFESILIVDERAFRHQIRENSKKAA